MLASPNPKLFLFALRYWSGVFAIAFMIGAFRTLWLAPRIGALAGVLAELPVLLAASWFWTRHLLKHANLLSRVEAMGAGAIAFVLLMIAELALGVFGFGQTLRVWLLGFTHAPGLIGLAGQIGFAIMPALVWRRGGDMSPH